VFLIYVEKFEKPKRSTLKMHRFLIIMFLVILSIIFTNSAFAQLEKRVSSEEDWRQVFHLVSQLESSGSLVAIGDLDKEDMSYGYVQIRQDYLTDALVWASENKDNTYASGLLILNESLGGKSENILGTHIMVSYYIFRCYMNRWASKGKLGHVPTVEDIIRIHNGGGPKYGHSEWVVKTQPHIDKAWALVLGKT